MTITALVALHYLSVFCVTDNSYSDKMLAAYEGCLLDCMNN